MSGQRPITADLLGKELVFSSSRSSGPGGQNVNKVNSKVTVQFDVQHSAVLTEEEKAVIARKLSSKLTREGMLIVSAQENRSQLQNKEAVIAKLESIFVKAFEKKKIRKPTRPSKRAVQSRVKKKKVHGEKKKWRRKPGTEGAAD